MREHGWTAGAGKMAATFRKEYQEKELKASTNWLNVVQEKDAFNSCLNSKHGSQTEAARGCFVC